MDCTNLAPKTRSWPIALACLLAAALMTAPGPIATAGGRNPRPKTIDPEEFEGRLIFMKVWEPGEPSPAGGDGLGPLYDERSCAGCHHLGGPGGAGGNDRNVVVLSASNGPAMTGNCSNVFQGELEELHPGFLKHASVVVHKNATSEAAKERLGRIASRTIVQTRDECIALKKSERNTPALFGAGLIDQVPDRVLLEAEKRKFPNFPEIKGRVSRLPDGRIGRFGWKGQTATLKDFVLAACSNELGLEVVGHHQVSLAAPRDFDPSKLKLDLDDAQCDLLARFVRSLPRPLRVSYSPGTETPGYAVFQSIGCATCHARALGNIDGIYSDLLLHDLGDRISAAGGYGSPPSVSDLAESNGQPRTSGPAGPTEWRTAPLWGIADSAPYLHDGRAETLDAAIRLHGGEAATTAERYGKLERGDRRALLQFLHSLVVAPRPKARKAASRPAARTPASERPSM
jgi:CxxC motif-containing protein (DUF1111 family)